MARGQASQHVCEALLLKLLPQWMNDVVERYSPCNISHCAINPAYAHYFNILRDAGVYLRYVICFMVNVGGENLTNVCGGINRLFGYAHMPLIPAPYDMLYGGEIFDKHIY